MKDTSTLHNRSGPARPITPVPEVRTGALLVDGPRRLPGETYTRTLLMKHARHSYASH